MKYLFLAVFAVMAALSVVAYLWTPIDTDDRIELVWVSDDNPVRREQIEVFNALHPRYALRLDPQNSGMQKVIVQSLAGVGPDLFDCYNPFQLTAFVRSGIALDCTDELVRRGVDPEAVWPFLKNIFVHEGRVYGHPDNCVAPAVWFNKKIFDEEGIPYPREDWTWDECIDLAKRLMVYDDRGRPTRFGLLIGNWDWKVLLPQWGAAFYNEEGTRCILDSPEAGEALQFYQDLMYQHGVCPSPVQEAAMSSVGGWGQGPIKFLGAGRGAMAVGGRWWLCQLRKEGYEDLELGAVSMPRGPVAALLGGGRSTLVNATGKNLEGALEFIEFLHSQRWTELINDQADALGPVKKYHYGEYEPRFLHNPDYPEEDFNAVWRDALEVAIPEPSSLFVNGNTAERHINQQVDLVRENLKSGADAMRKAAEKVNEAIIEQLEMDPVSRERYYELVEQGAPPAWDNEEDAP